MEVYIIRHGETVWNAEGKLQGQTDIELNEKGRELAGKLGERLEDVDFDKIFASPLIRAYETACLIRGHRNIKIDRDDRLKELCFGEEEGCDFRVWTNEECQYRPFFFAPQDYKPPKGGESFEEIRARAKEFLQEVVEPLHKECDRIMIVAHGALNKGLMSYIEDNDVAHFWGEGLQQNCEADVFVYDGSSWMRKD